MADPLAEAGAWLTDFLSNVFMSPSWETPLMNFIDAHCQDFDSSLENKLEHTAVHARFTELVDSLLEAHLSEIGLSSEDFMAVLAKAPQHSELRTVVMEQIMAVDDFLTFKKLMVKRNAELHVEVLEAAAAARAPSSSGVTAPLADADLTEALRRSALDRSATALPGGSAVDDSGLDSALKASRVEFEALERARAALEMAQIESAIAASLAMEEQRIALERAAKDAHAAATDDAPGLPAISAPMLGTAAAAAVLPPLPGAAMFDGAGAGQRGVTSAPSAAPAPPPERATHGSRVVSASALPPISGGGASSTALPPISRGRGSGGEGSTRPRVDVDELDALLSGVGQSLRNDTDVEAARGRAEALFSRNRAKLEELEEISHADGQDAAEVERRRTHLQELRGQLRAQKAAERAAALDAVTGASASALPSGGAGPGVRPPAGPGNDEAARRAALAARIRAEVVGSGGRV